MPFAYIVTPTACVNKEFDTFPEAFNSLEELIAKNITEKNKTNFCVTISAQELGEKEQAMLVLAIL